mgnify:CR=1 FL=1
MRFMVGLRCACPTLRLRGRCALTDRPPRRQAGHLTIAGRIPLRGVFRDRVNVETKRCGKVFAHPPDFINNGIR